MEKRVELEKRGRSPSQIKELNLDNTRSPVIIGITDEFVNLEILSLINVGLTTLKGFPSLPKLKRLELSENRISGGLNFLSGSPELSILNLCGNKIRDFEALEPLKDFKHLKNLDLYNCEVTIIENYRERVFNLIPSLKYLDGFDRQDIEARDASEIDEDEEEDLENEEELDNEDEDFEEVDEDDEDDEDDDEEEDDDDDEEDEEEDEEDDEEDVNLSALIGDIDEEENEENFQPNGEHAEEDDDTDNESEDLSESDQCNLKNENEKEQRGIKRKHVDDDEKQQ